MVVIKALECFNDGYDWIVDIDLKSFFDEVNRGANLVSLIREFLKSGAMEKVLFKKQRKESRKVET